MAETVENVPIMRPKVAAWKVKEKEAELFALVSEVPNWKLADKCRRLLLDLNYKLTDRIPTVDVERLVDGKSAVAKQVAVTTLAGVTIRASGSAMALISTGYVPSRPGQPDAAWKLGFALARSSMMSRDNMRGTGCLDQCQVGGSLRIVTATRTTLNSCRSSLTLMREG